MDEKREETLFRLPAVTVTGYTLVYDDARLRAAIEAADAGSRQPGSDRGEEGILDLKPGGDIRRFFFATALAFRPPLPPMVGPASIRPTVEREARRSFVDDLEARGFSAVETGESQRIRTESGERARLRKVTAELAADGEGPARIHVEGWIAVWTTDGEFLIAGGASPVEGVDAMLASLPEAERPSTDPERFREELVGLIRATER